MYVHTTMCFIKDIIYNEFYIRRKKGISAFVCIYIMSHWKDKQRPNKISSGRRGVRVRLFCTFFLFEFLM